MTTPNVFASKPIELSELRRILTLTRNYPSGDDSQPFRFNWNGSRLEIEYEVLGSGFRSYKFGT